MTSPAEAPALLPSVASFLGEEHGLLIDGRWVPNENALGSAVRFIIEDRHVFDGPTTHNDAGMTPACSLG